MKLKTRTLVLSLIGMAYSHAAPITWSNAPYTVSGNIGQDLNIGQFNSTGVQVLAENTGGGALSFDGINFTAGSISMGGGSASVFHQDQPPGNTMLAKDGSYGNGGPSTVNLTGLSIGESYRIQALIYDGRGDYTGRTVKFDGIDQGRYANGVPFNTWGDGLLVTGTFVADATTQNFTIEAFSPGGASAGGQLNAITVYRLIEAFPENNGTWTSLTSGNWSDPANWQGNTIASGVSKTATFNAATGVSVAMDSVFTVGHLVFGVSDYIITGPSSLTLDDTAPTVTVASGTQTRIETGLAGFSGFDKNGSGSLVLSANNSYSGTTFVNEGTLQIGDGGTTGTLGAGNVTIASNLTFHRSNYYQTVGSNVFTGAGSITKEGAGELVLGGVLPNSFFHSSVEGIETVVVNGGVIRTASWGQWNSNLDLTVNNSGIFEMWHTNVSLANLSGNGTVRNSADYSEVISEPRTGSTLTVAAGSFSGTITDLGITSGVDQVFGDTRVNLVKTGSGTLTLSGLNTYQGATTINDGTLSVSQSNFADSSTVTIGTEADSPAVLNLQNAGTDVVTALVIDGVSQPGGGLIYDSTTSPGAITGVGKIQVSASVGGYTSWATGGEPFDGDANGDDVQDGLAWFLGAATPATNALDKLPQPAKNGLFLTLGFQRVNPYAPARLFVEFGNDLSGWDAVEIPAATSTIILPGDDVEVEVTGGTPDLVTVKIPTSYQSASGALFARLRATNN